MMTSARGTRRIVHRVRRAVFCFLVRLSMYCSCRDGRHGGDGEAELKGSVADPLVSVGVGLLDRDDDEDNEGERDGAKCASHWRPRDG